ncbi:MAG: SDR family oxidoreductase [Proteobacteria bacterium]|nr:SDR family oxidoreductase [Pseudomonadota bacterium]
MNLFKDKVAIVTGAASGIGQALCEELGRRGALVIVTDINSEGAEKVASAIQAHGGRATAREVDVSKEEDVQNIVERTVSEHGRLDFMFNNAGIDIGGELRDLRTEHWRRVIDINLWGVIYGSSAAYQVMVKQGYGHIVNTASMVGLFPLPMETAYVTAKHAVVGFSGSLYIEAAALGVHVSVICPDFVKSSFYKDSKHINVDEAQLISQIPDFVYVSPQRCALIALRGVARKKLIVTVGIFSKLLWGLYRYTPTFFLLGQRIYARRLRRLRIGP